MEKTTCLQCDKEFLARSEDLVRGRARFCSISCGAVYSNKNRPLINHKCKHCESDFQSKNTKSLYCSKTCAQRERRKHVNVVYTRSTLSTRVNKYLISGTKSCLVCGWDKAVCDIHHVIPQRDGGDDNFENLTVLCPNCHRLADKGLLLDLPTVASRIGLSLQP